MMTITSGRTGLGEAMSGPKCYEYAVSAAELERQRAVSDAQARCFVLEQRAKSDAAEAATLGETVAYVESAPRIPSTATAEEAAAVAALYELHANEVARRCKAARAAAIARSFAVHVPKELQGKINLNWDSPADKAIAEQASVDDVAAHIIVSLAYVSDNATRTAWFDLAATLTTSGSSLARAKALSLEVHTHLRAQRQHESLTAEASEIALTLAAIDSPAAREAHQALACITDRASLKSATALAIAARAEHDAAVERRFVVEQTIEALAELGYEVDEDFRTTALAGGFAVAPRDGLAEYALQMRFDPVSAQLFTNTVALNIGTLVTADVAAETTTCADIESVGERLHRDGVMLTRSHTAAPGAVPIEHRTDIERKSPATRLRRAQQSKEREAGR